MLNKLHFSRILVLLISVSCLPNSPASAQYGASSGGGRPGTVSGTGESTVELKPDVMRMNVDLLAKAGTLKEAVKVLNARKESVRQTLEKFGVDKESIKFGDVSISDAQSEQQQELRQMMAMMEQRRGQTGRPKPAKTSVPVTVTCPLIAEWKLTADSAEELLLFVHPLQQKLREADLSGAKDVSALSAEQEEMLEEMQGEFGYSRSYSSGEQEPGTPVFTFSAAVSEKQVDEALAAAFQQAKTDAARLSKATGAELGKLVSVTSTVTQADEDDISYRQQYYYAQLVEAMGAFGNSQSNEAVGFKLGTVKKRFTVTAWFDFK